MTQPRALTLDLADRIKSLRREREWTWQDLAARLNVTAYCISAIESGATSPNVIMLEKLAAAFGVTLRVELG